MNTYLGSGRRTVAVLIAIVTALALVSTGCEQPNWEDPAYISSQLREGDATQRQIALGKLAELPEEKQKEAIPAVSEVYMAEGANQKDAMSRLVQLRAPAAKEAYLKELKTNATGYGGAAAEALGEIKAKDAIPEMLKLLDSTDEPEVKLGIIQAFQHMPDPQLVKPLTDILKLDVDNHPIQLHAYSCETLGNIAEEQPDAITDAVIKQVTLAVFYANMRNQSLDVECGIAIQKIGKRAIPELLKIYKGEREDVQKLMMKYDTPKSPFPQNHPKLIAAKRLASLRAKEAVEPFLKDLQSEKKAPKGLKGKNAVNWRMKEGAGTSETIYALGDIGDPRARETLEKIVKGEYINEEWDEITDGLISLQLRQDAGFALNRLGQRESADALLEMAKEGVIIDFERRAAMLEEAGKPVKPTERYQFNWMTAQAFASLAKGERLDEYKKMVAAQKDDYPKLAEKMNEFTPMLELAKECEATGDAAAQAKCYGSKLNDKSPTVREKAAWELGRLDAKVAGPIIVENLGVDFLDTREILTFDLYRMPSQEALEKINAVLEDEKDKGGADYRLDHFRLKLLRAYLENTLE